MAELIEGAGRQPGIWLAPFIAAPDSQVATEHPEWLARMPNGKPLWGMFNPSWGGGMDGVMYALDTTQPEVIAHLEHVARSLVALGFTYLKLDFTFAPSFDGVWSDASRTPAERVRAGLRRHSTRRGRRGLLARLRRAAEPRAGRGRRQSDRPRCRTVVGTARQRRCRFRATRESSPRPCTRGSTPCREASCIGDCG